MSYKQEFQSNNADLQGLIDLANSLPEAENLDTELSTQDDLIAQIAAALEGKTGASGGAVQTTFFLFVAIFTLFLAIEIRILLKAIKQGPEIDK